MEHHHEPPRWQLVLDLVWYGLCLVASIIAGAWIAVQEGPSTLLVLCLPVAFCGLVVWDTAQQLKGHHGHGEAGAAAEDHQEPLPHR